MVRQAVRGLQVQEETTYSLEVSWQLEDPKVDQYRVTYVSLTGDRNEESVSLELLLEAETGYS